MIGDVLIMELRGVGGVVRERGGSGRFFFLRIRRPPRSTQSRSSAASDVYKRQLLLDTHTWLWWLAGELLSSEAADAIANPDNDVCLCLLYTSPSPRDRTRSRMPSSA